MKKSPRFQTRTVIIPANAIMPMGFPGSVIQCRSTNGASGAILLQLGPSGDTLAFDAGDQYTVEDGNSFDNIQLQNTTGAPVTVKFSIGDGKIQSAQSVSITNQVAVLPVKSNTFTGIADVTITGVSGGGFANAVAPAAATQRTINITANPNNNGAGLRIGGAASVGVTQGTLLMPGQTMSIDTAAAVWAYATVNTDSVSLSAVSD